MDRNRLAAHILTAALVILYASFGIDKFVAPINWVQWIPPWLDGSFGMDANAWLKVIGVGEIVLATLLLIPNRRVRQVGAIGIALSLVGILTQVGWNDMGARDFAILLSSLALFVLL
ncbi:MAG: hypothetical protein Q7R81_00635 [Candidatus Peregrinibacteria bacterium]|nr:hypothetical protein [Candidatus Peregrinibacteria bacterium]